eukprot:XP_014788358.1 PREDICTED: uncharacterized protein K02A2.6-like [Octopus bimaculoides]
MGVSLCQEKNNEIRVCADFSTGLNECLIPYNYSLPSPEEIFTKLNGGKFFSKLVLSEAYLQVKVDEECSKLLSINTYKRLYIFNRLPFGIKVAPGIFQQVMDTMLAGSDFAIAYLDSILIKSESWNIIVSDNGTQFMANEFKNFYKMYSNEYISTPPYHPRLNRQAERFVDTFKRALKKFRNELVNDVALTQFLSLPCNAKS